MPIPVEEVQRRQRLARQLFAALPPRPYAAEGLGQGRQSSTPAVRQPDVPLALLEREVLAGHQPPGELDGALVGLATRRRDVAA